MRRSLFALTLFAAGALGGCGGNNYYGHTSHSCDVVSFGAFAQSNDVYEIAAGASFVTPDGYSNPIYGITSNGQGLYHVQFSDPTGAATCFQGLITVENPLPANPIATDGTQAFVSPDGLQLAFSGIPGANPEFVELQVGSDVVNVEGYVEGSATYADFYYPDAQTGVLTVTPQSIAAFVSP